MESPEKGNFQLHVPVPFLSILGSVPAASLLYNISGNYEFIWWDGVTFLDSESEESLLHKVCHMHLLTTAVVFFKHVHGTGIQIWSNGVPVHIDNLYCLTFLIAFAQYIVSLVDCKAYSYKQACKTLPKVCRQPRGQG